MFRLENWDIFTREFTGKMTSKAKKETLFVITIIALLLGYWIGSEIYYGRSISPRGVSNVGEYFKRFGEPQLIGMLERDGRKYYEFYGRLPSAFILAFPSSPPAYVFDEQGRLVTWCRDPGDTPSFQQQWPLQNTNKIEIKVVRKKFGL
jgi:hypothetical protein